jgi:hypothetical protein
MQKDFILPGLVPRLYRFSAPSLPKLYPKVKRLVEAALDSKKAHRSFKRLEALGDECVPSIIMLMVDALAAILNQLTSEYISITM